MDGAVSNEAFDDFRNEPRPYERNGRVARSEKPGCFWSAGVIQKRSGTLIVLPRWTQWEQPWQRPAAATARRLVFVRTSSVVQHRRRGCSRRRSGSRRAPAARPAVGCSFAPGAVTSAARIASLHHAYGGSDGLDAVVTAPVLAASGSSASTPSFGLTDPSACGGWALLASCRTAIVASGRWSCFCNSPLIRLHPRTIAITAKRSSGCDTSARLLSRQRDRELGAGGMSKADVSGRATCDARGPQDAASGSLLADRRFIAGLIGGMVVE